jgi:hypothetical protein
VAAKIVADSAAGCPLANLKRLLEMIHAGAIRHVLRSYRACESVKTRPGPYPAGRVLPPEMNFGLIAMVLLATLAIIVTLMFPEIQLQPAEFLVGP